MLDERKSMPRTRSVPSAPGAGNIITAPGPPEDASNRKMNKDVPCAKHWCFTWNNYPDNAYEILRSFSDVLAGLVCGKEVAPTTGQRHLQGHLEFKVKSRPSTLKVLWDSHVYFEKSRDPKASKAYAAKDGQDILSWGTCQTIQPYTMNVELRPWQKEIADIVSSEPDDRTIYWFFEGAGGIGKTTLQKYLYLNSERVIVLSGKATDMKHGIVTYVEKNKQPPRTVVIDIPRCQDTEHISWQGIEEIKNMFFFSGKYEGGMICGHSPHVLIFSNHTPPTEKLSRDRWKVYRIEDDMLREWASYT